MHKRLLLPVLISIALTGCFDDKPLQLGTGNECVTGDCTGTLPPVTPPVTPPVIPEGPDEEVPDPDIPAVTTYTASLLSSTKSVSGDISCNGKELPDSKASFTVEASQPVSCLFGSITLADFTAPAPIPALEERKRSLQITFDIENEKGAIEGPNATRVLQSISTCVATPDEICLQGIDSVDIADVYKNKLGDTKAVDDFLAVKNEEATTDDVGKAPSSHVDSSVVPEVTPGSSSDLNSGFVSPGAESSYAYKPSPAGQVLTRSILMDDKDRPIAGMSFFSVNAIGETAADGTFEYLWGDELTFGIDTFEFGALKGNQVDYKLTDVTENPLVKENIQSLLERYGVSDGATLSISDKVKDTFDDYPNEINNIINLNLPNGGALGESGFILPNEFEAQFNSGLAKVIDDILRQPSPYSFSAPSSFTLSGGNVTQALNAILGGVTTFHVFNDNRSYYGASGATRGMRMLNLSNRAFPVVMPRADINRRIPFGEPQAWTREGKPYFATWPGIITPAKIPLVSKDTATFGFPFVTAGIIGKGNVVFMGNSLYPSILSCPDNYWADNALSINSETKTCTTTLENDPRDDKGSMKRFFDNLFLWFEPGMSAKNIAVATNIERTAAARNNVAQGNVYDFFIDDAYGFSSVTQVSKGGFSALSAAQTPILILQAYPATAKSNLAAYAADLDNPNLTQEDITALIRYINDGGNVLFMDAIVEKINPEPIGRLADAAGMSVGGVNVTPTNQSNCGDSSFCQIQPPRFPYIVPNVHVKGQYEMVVYERFPDEEGKPPYTIDPDGTVTWNPPEKMPNLGIPTYNVPKLDANGKPVIDSAGQPETTIKAARIFVKDEAEKIAALAEIQNAFKGAPLCTQSYEYEVDCIETRLGDGIIERGSHAGYETYGRKDFDRYPMSQDVIASMITAANLGSNVQALMDHEIYYRTKGKEGKRLSTVKLNQTYDNLSIWLWNDNAYKYDSSIEDELGFETLVGFLNCYTNDKHGEGLTCPATLKETLFKNNMIHRDGELAGQLNPSYPLNYMEKPLTRIMLGRSFWDHDITVDTTGYPGRGTLSSASSGKALIETAGSGVAFSAGNNQPTGFWAPQLQDVTVTGGVAAQITVMMADDLTGRPQHETSLKRPPRMQMSFAHDGSSTTFKVPYGGLISISPRALASTSNGVAEFSFSGVEKAPLFKEGAWVNTPESATAPIAEIDTGSFIYTTPKKNVKEEDVDIFSDNMNRFSDAVSDFYGRDEETPNGMHRRFTYPALKGFRHRFVNDVQISIGAAHSGYPVMNTGFNINSTTIPTNSVTSWLLWHELGHNLAAAPFLAPGSTEVTNNILGLYMQELDDGVALNPEMVRIKTDIQKAPFWLKDNNGHAWSNGNAGMRLVMFGQLKIWAENNFKIDDWYKAGDSKPTVYNTDEGWNMFKLMHRKARGDVQGDAGINYCSSAETKLSSSDLMMVCSSYISGVDLSQFFTTWNVGETSNTTPDGTKIYSGGISAKGKAYLKTLGLKPPTVSPLTINALPK